MEVDGRKYVITNSETVLQLLSNIGKILVLVLTDSLVLIQLVYCVLALLQLIYVYIYARRRYTWLNLREKPDFKAIAQKKSVLVHQIYTGGINDANYTNVYLVFLFVIMNLLSNGKLPSNHVLEFSGKFEETRSHAICEMIINIVVSVIAIIMIIFSVDSFSGLSFGKLVLKGIIHSIWILTLYIAANFVFIPKFKTIL